MTGYLIVYCDYEGLDVRSLHDENTVKDAFYKIVGINKQAKELHKAMVTDHLEEWYDETDSKETMNMKLKIHGKKQDELEELYWERCGELGIDPFVHYDDHDRYCILRVDENGSKCVCAEFGVAPEKSVYY